jgi:hypothetical protein
VLPKDYARPALNKVMLGELIDLVSGIGMGEVADRLASVPRAFSVRYVSRGMGEVADRLASVPRAFSVRYVSPPARLYADDTLERLARIVACARCDSNIDPCLLARDLGDLFGAVGRTVDDSEEAQLFRELSKEEPTPQTSHRFPADRTRKGSFRRPGRL